MHVEIPLSSMWILEESCLNTVKMNQNPHKIKSELQSGTVCDYLLFFFNWKHFTLSEVGLNTAKRLSTLLTLNI